MYVESGQYLFIETAFITYTHSRYISGLPHLKSSRLKIKHRLGRSSNLLGMMDDGTDTARLFYCSGSGKG